MLTRRSFVFSSLAMAWLAQTSRLRAATIQDPDDKARLILHFAGGTAFKRIDGRLVAVQLSGRYLGGEPFIHPVSRQPMLHRSFIVVPVKGTGFTPFPEDYGTQKLNARITPAKDWAPYCLEHKDVDITAVGGEPFEYKCKKVAHYGDYPAKGWTPIGDWMDRRLSFGKNVSSRFSIANGVLDDGTAHNKHAKSRYWKIGNGSWGTLSDIATLALEATSITIAITGLREPITITNGNTLEAFVFSGPVAHAHVEKYYHIHHSLLLHTIFNIPPGGDVRPWTDKYVEHKPEGSYDVHPCDLSVAPRLGAQLRPLSPPDSDYCVNYDEFP